LKGYISYHLEDISIKVFSVNVEMHKCADNSQTVHFMQNVKEKKIKRIKFNTRLLSLERLYLLLLIRYKRKNVCYFSQDSYGTPNHSDKAEK